LDIIKKWPISFGHEVKKKIDLGLTEKMRVNKKKSWLR
jgi:hypothetical protein